MKPQPWIGTLIGAWIFAISQTCALAQAPVHVRTWTFTLADGTVQIDLRAYPDGTSSLGIGPDQQGHEAPIAEQVEPLKQVLAEMPGLGVDPRRLTYIGKRIFGFGEDVTKKLAYACADSKECRFKKQSPEKEKVRELIALLNQSRTIEPHNEAFKEYGIRARVTDAEKVILIRFSTVPPRNSRDRSNGRMLVLGGADVGMRFSPINSTPN
ncbi:MAG: hypothetical protein ACHQIK_02610 [Candidatus Acidiferrales bacterium]